MKVKSKVAVETMEARTLMSGSTFVYTESNNPNPGENAVLGYRENVSTGVLTALPHGRFLTGGTGYLNAGNKLGPSDSDKEVIATPDGKFLFAVNQGSNSVSEFAIASNGSLRLLDSAPFASGGTQPVSLSFNKNNLYVLNRGNAYEGISGTIAPTLSTFIIGEDGAAIPLPNSSVNLPLNLSPAQVLTTADGKFTFVDNFATPSNLKVSLENTIEPFAIGAAGSLTAVKNGAAGVSTNPPLLLGLVEDPVHHLIYSGLAPGGGVATFSYNDNTGRAAYVSSSVGGGKATCWLTISPDGKYLYGTDTGSNAVSVYSLANPLKPTLIQEFALNGPTNVPGSASTAPVATADFQLSFDSTGHYLYVINQSTGPAFQQGNQLHTLSVGQNGKLSESVSSPQFFSSDWVPDTARVQGLAVVTKQSPLGRFSDVLAAVFSKTEFSSSGASKLQALLDTLLQDLIT